MNKFHLALAASLLALTACPTTDGGTTDSGDTGEAAVYEGPWQVAGFVWSCDTTSGDYSYEVTMDGWADSATLDTFETGAWGGLADPTNTGNAWEETHTLTQGDYGEDGSWDSWVTTLTNVTTPSAVDNTTTLFSCGTHGEAELAWMMTADFGANGADCAVFGNEADDWWNTTQGNSCYVF